MSQLSEIWGASDKPKKYELEYTLQENLLCVHQRIVAIQDIIEEQVHGATLMKHFELTGGALNALLGLDESWFEDKPASTSKIAKCADKCRNTQLYTHAKQLLKDDKKNTNYGS